MTPRKFPAVFMRGGTSKGIMFHARDLPAARAEWDEIFLRAMGSPDPGGRQLDGMGGGVSSLSKVCVIAPSQRGDADVDYTFAQVQIREARVDYGANCGNMSSAVGPFALEEGLVRAAGGATTGRLLPSGNVVDALDIPGLGKFEVSLVDAANACVFVAAAALGLKGTEMPEELERDTATLQKLAAIRLHASVAMGIARTLDEARAKAAVPFVGFVSAAQDARTLSGEGLAADAADLTVRMISNGQPHRALPLTASLCTAVAARMEGSVVWKASRRGAAGELRLAMPSGVLTVGAEVSRAGAIWQAARGSFYRTARRLFEGCVYA